MMNYRPPFSHNFAVIGILAVTGAIAQPPTPSSQMGELVAGNTAFAIDLYCQLRSNAGNIIFSPSSISTSLAMTYAGAKGKTADEIAKTFHFTLSQESLHPAFAALGESLKEVQQKGQVTLAEANSLWPQEGYKFLPDFLSMAPRCFEWVI